eukprot:81036-Rhodomonas_salina.1
MPVGGTTASSSPTLLATASSRSPTRTAVTLGPEWSSPGRTQGFHPPAPVLTMVGSPSRGAATSARILTDASPRRTPHTRSGAPAPREHPRAPRMHCFGQPIIPRSDRPRLNSGDEPLSCFFRHPLTNPSRSGAASRAR